MAAALLVPARLLSRRKRIPAGEDAIKHKMTQAHFVFLFQVEQGVETVPKVAALSFEGGRKRDGL